MKTGKLIFDLDHVDHTVNGTAEAGKANIVNSTSQVTLSLPPALAGKYVPIIKENSGLVTANADGTDVIADGTAGGSIYCASLESVGAVWLYCFVDGKWSIGSMFMNWSTT